MSMKKSPELKKRAKEMLAATVGLGVTASTLFGLSACSAESEQSQSPETKPAATAPETPGETTETSAAETSSSETSAEEPSGAETSAEVEPSEVDPIDGMRDERMTKEEIEREYSIKSGLTPEEFGEAYTKLITYWINAASTKEIIEQTEDLNVEDSNAAYRKYAEEISADFAMVAFGPGWEDDDEVVDFVESQIRLMQMVMFSRALNEYYNDSIGGLQYRNTLVSCTLLEETDGKKVYEVTFVNHNNTKKLGTDVAGITDIDGRSFTHKAIIVEKGDRAYIVSE